MVVGGGSKRKFLVEIALETARPTTVGDNAIAIPEIRLYWQIGSNAALTVQKIRAGYGYSGNIMLRLSSRIAPVRGS